MIGEDNDHGQEAKPSAIDGIPRSDWGDGSRTPFQPPAESESGTALTPEGQEEAGAVVPGPAAPDLAPVINTVMNQYLGTSREEAMQTIADSAEAFLQDHVLDEDRAIFIECFDSFTSGLQAKLIGLVVQHGTRGDWRAFYETRVRPKLTLEEQVQVNDLL